MKIIDISWPIGLTMTQYKDRKDVQIDRVHKDGEYYVMEHLLRLHTHTGTHVDAPLHFISEEMSIDKMPLSSLIGRCFVADVTQITDHIGQRELENIPAQAGDIVLFKTRNSTHAWDGPFNQSFVYLNSSAAQDVVQRRYKADGIDYLGIERNQSNHPTHRILGQAHIPIVEGLRLEEAVEGFYFACILPLKIVSMEAAPARAILLSEFL